MAKVILGNAPTDTMLRARSSSRIVRELKMQQEIFADSPQTRVMICSVHPTKREVVVFGPLYLESVEFLTANPRGDVSAVLYRSTESGSYSVYAGVDSVVGFYLVSPGVLLSGETREPTRLEKRQQQEWPTRLARWLRGRR